MPGEVKEEKGEADPITSRSEREGGREGRREEKPRA
jgi:hypothetical protein